MTNESRGDAVARGPAPTPASDATSSEEFVPRTPLGRKLWALRQQIIASGIPLLTAEEIEAELAEQRREPGDSEERPAPTSTRVC
jgi:hypothetical protein